MICCLIYFKTNHYSCTLECLLYCRQLNFTFMGSLLLGITYLVSGFITLGMFIYFLVTKGNGLKSILCHLFASWCVHYLIIGSITFFSYIAHQELVPLDTLRFMAAIFVAIQFIALLRLYAYIMKKNG